MMDGDQDESDASLPRHRGSKRKHIHVDEDEEQEDHEEKSNKASKTAKSAKPAQRAAAKGLIRYLSLSSSSASASLSSSAASSSGSASSSSSSDCQVLDFFPVCYQTDSTEPLDRHDPRRFFLECSKCDSVACCVWQSRACSLQYSDL